MADSEISTTLAQPKGKEIPKYLLSLSALQRLLLTFGCVQGGNQ
jgi:hypothetical protein